MIRSQLASKITASVRNWIHFEINFRSHFIWHGTIKRNPTRMLAWSTDRKSQERYTARSLIFFRKEKVEHIHAQLNYTFNLNLIILHKTSFDWWGFFSCFWFRFFTMMKMFFVTFSHNKNVDYFYLWIILFLWLWQIETATVSVSFACTEKNESV